MKITFDIVISLVVRDHSIVSYREMHMKLSLPSIIMCSLLLAYLARPYANSIKRSLMMIFTSSLITSIILFIIPMLPYLSKANFGLSMSMLMSFNILFEIHQETYV